MAKIEKKEKATPIVFKYDGIDYKLEFTKGSVKQMEENGFKFDKESLTSLPITAITELWNGSFLAHHRWTKDNLKEEIYNKMPNKDDLFTRLVELYYEPANQLFAEPEEGEAISWS